jgi:hypothetical protein
MCRPRVGEANSLFFLCRALWRPTALAKKSPRKAEESRTNSKRIPQIKKNNNNNKNRKTITKKQYNVKDKKLKQYNPPQKSKQKCTPHVKTKQQTKQNKKKQLKKKKKKQKQTEVCNNFSLPWYFQTLLLLIFTFSNFMHIQRNQWIFGII